MRVGTCPALYPRPARLSPRRAHARAASRFCFGVLLRPLRPLGVVPWRSRHGIAALKPFWGIPSAGGPRLDQLGTNRIERLTGAATHLLSRSRSQCSGSRHTRGAHHPRVTRILPPWDEKFVTLAQWIPARGSERGARPARRPCCRAWPRPREGRMPAPARREVDARARRAREAPRVPALAADKHFDPSTRRGRQPFICRAVLQPCAAVRPCLKRCARAGASSLLVGQMPGA